ncbi:uncharacterized protein LOC135944434 isoform X1 [Cloeon dipterum]|uniref:uncharacterized protein LOC135944434 isoform X1 n=2 Tax=Cloeon dipterum TaxID=197152 RepID=UPI00321FAA15
MLQKNMLVFSAILAFYAVSAFAAKDSHPCRRSCNNSTQPMTCYYNFEVEPYQTLSKACYACAFGNVTDCMRQDCVAGDGVARLIAVVNRQLPGPEIRVCYGDKIVVDVHNSLMSETTSVHWHGHHQKGSPHMDGVPSVTQCPISPGSTFRYIFKADTQGTHFWHSHSGVQRGDGVFGALIIEDPVDPHRSLYDFDLPEHVIILNDWLHESTISKLIAHHFAAGDNKPDNILVNGKGRYESGNNSFAAPLENFVVKKGKKYRFRLINSGYNNCPMELSVDNHTITVISTDGSNLQPIPVDSVVSYAGERFDFVLSANQSIGRYWIRIKGLMDCDERFRSAFQAAILTYEGANMSKEPEPFVSYKNAHREGKQLNSLNLDSFDEDISKFTVAEIHSLEPGDVKTLTANADHTIYIGYDFYPKDNPLTNPAGKYGFHEVLRKEESLTTPQLNNITLMLPPTPLIMQSGEQLNALGCNDTSLRMQGKDCAIKDFCKCLHRIKVNVNDIVDFVLFDEGNRFDANHPFHLHGHAFHVMAIKKLGMSTNLQEVKKFMQQSKKNKKVNLHAILKDTVSIPDGGLAQLRIKAANPGVWLFHCHIGFHVEIGMAFVVQVGEPEQFAPTPKGFPKCGDWIPNDLDDGPDVSDNTIVLINGGKDKDKVTYQIVHNITVNVKNEPPKHQGILNSWLNGRNAAPQERISLTILTGVLSVIILL